MEKDGDYTGAHIDGEPSDFLVSVVNVGNGGGFNIGPFRQVKGPTAAREVSKEGKLQAYGLIDASAITKNL